MQDQVIVEKEPNLCFKIWHIANTIIFSLFVMIYVSYEFKVFKINTVVDSLHPGAGSCWSPNTPNWKNCDSFVFSYTKPGIHGIAPDGQPYINVTAEYHGICVGALWLSIIHFCSTFMHCIPASRKIAHKFQIVLHIATMVCAIVASVKIYSNASRSCGECIHEN